jgi:hypothetical protein
MSPHSHPSNPHSLHISPDILASQMQNVALSPSPGTDTASSENSLASFRTFVSYTQAQILSLYKSPLVSPPRGMPILKDWFGYATPSFPSRSSVYHSSGIGMNKMPRKRTPIPLPPLQEPGTNGMSYSSIVCGYTILTSLSFRRDQEDAGTRVIPSYPLRALTTSAELPSRATFRSTSSQPSQMGNFKHQSIRSSEREKDKDADRDRERDLRDKEGQERLRSVSPWLLYLSFHLTRLAAL